MSIRLHTYEAVRSEHSQQGIDIEGIINRPRWDQKEAEARLKEEAGYAKLAELKPATERRKTTSSSSKKR